MHVEIEDAAALESYLRSASSLRGVVAQGVDLRALTEALLAVPGAGGTFLGCALEAPAAEHLRASGALLFPELGDRPYRPYRPALYTPAELLEGLERDRPESFWESSRDARIYAWYAAERGHDVPLLEALAQRLHDHAIDDAKHDLLAGAGSGGEPRRCFAIMGGHAMRRDEPAFAQVAEIARALAREGYFLVSGGGPGAMEATNLGAWLAPHEDAALTQSLAMLARAPTYRHPEWIISALEVCERFEHGAESLAIPTWFYGHEPTNLFATHVAKYFSNSLREDGLLAIATHGVLYAPGSAGTVQEVFMDAAQNHYGTFEVVSPMIFLGRDYWRTERPVAPLLERLADGRQYAERITYVDDTSEVLAFVRANPPVPYVAG